MSGLEEILDGMDGGKDDGTDDGTGTGSNDTGGSDGNAGSAGKGTDTGTDGDAGDGPADGDAGNDDNSSGKGDDSTPDPLEELRSSQEELRQMLRVSRRENATMKAKLDRLSKKPANSGDDDDETGGDGEAGSDQQLSRIEELQQTLQHIHETRGASLELLATQMAETKTYADVAEVCSRQNMDDILDAAAGALQEQTGADFNELVLELEAAIWSKQNPYSYLYNLVKTHHPKYQNAESDTGESRDKADPNKKASSSIQDMGGAGDKTAGGWTAEKIDALPEDELHKVPADVYDKYLAGEMD